MNQYSTPQIAVRVALLSVSLLATLSAVFVALTPLTKPEWVALAIVGGGLWIAGGLTGILGSRPYPDNQPISYGFALASLTSLAAWLTTLLAPSSNLMANLVGVWLGLGTFFLLVFTLVFYGWTVHDLFLFGEDLSITTG